MLHTNSLFKIIGNSNDNLHNISRYRKRNANTPHDVIFDIMKLNYAGKIAWLLNIVQHIFIDSLSVSMLEWK